MTFSKSCSEVALLKVKGRPKISIFLVIGAEIEPSPISLNPALLICAIIDQGAAEPYLFLCLTW